MPLRKHPHHPSGGLRHGADCMPSISDFASVIECIQWRLCMENPDSSGVDPSNATL
ncbi:hypothetical protein [Azospirillum argentinense]